MATSGAPARCCAAAGGAATRFAPATSRTVSGALALRAARAPRRRCDAGPARRTLAVTASAAAWPAGAKLAGACACRVDPYRRAALFWGNTAPMLPSARRARTRRHVPRRSVVRPDARFWAAHPPHDGLRLCCVCADATAASRRARAPRCRLCRAQDGSHERRLVQAS